MRLFELPNETLGWRTLVDLDSVIAVSVTEDPDTVSKMEPDKRWRVRLHTNDDSFAGTVDSHEAVEAIIELVRERPMTRAESTLRSIDDALWHIEWALALDYKATHGSELPERPS